MKSLMLKKMAQSLVVGSVITLGAAGMASAAGAGDQTGQYGDMSGHGGPVDKKGASKGDRPDAGQTNKAPEPSGYRQSGGAAGQNGAAKGGSTSGSGSAGNTGSTGSSGQSGGGGY
jgi:hypothetical protein